MLSIKDMCKIEENTASSFFPRKVTSLSLRTTVVNLIDIAVKVYNALLLNHIQPEIEKIKEENRKENLSEKNDLKL